MRGDLGCVLSLPSRRRTRGTSYSTVNEGRNVAGVLPTVKRFMEDNEDGYGRRVTMEELKALSDKDRADFKQMLAERGIKCD